MKGNPLNGNFFRTDADIVSETLDYQILIDSLAGRLGRITFFVPVNYHIKDQDGSVLFNTTTEINIMRISQWYVHGDTFSFEGLTENHFIRGTFSLTEKRGKILEARFSTFKETLCF